MTPKLEAQDIRLAYPQPRTDTQLVALDGVNLQVMDGEFVAIVGPSGCGKTTFLSVVDGLIAATGGRVLVDGEVVTRPGPDRAVVFQDASLLPWRTVLGNVRYGLECLGARGGEADARAGKLIALVGLSGFEHHYPHELSGGMQQRVGIARALVHEPALLLMDEPFAALDAQTRTLLHGQLQEIWTETKKTILFVTHSVGEAVRLADRIVVLHAHPGRIRREIPVQLAHPRDFDSDDIADIVRGVRKEIEDEVNRVNAEMAEEYWNHQESVDLAGDTGMLGDGI
jgi:NitT/TauT family transport system ATP-binding protein